MNPSNHKHHYFPTFLKSELLKRKLRQSDLCRSLDFQRSKVSNWLAGRHHPQHPQDLVSIAIWLANDNQTKEQLLFNMLHAMVQDHKTNAN
jgi:transcriptional regulator with XRE-family HTH domain